MLEALTPPITILGLCSTCVLATRQHRVHLVSSIVLVNQNQTPQFLKLN